jgi:hypothetical protein
MELTLVFLALTELFMLQDLYRFANDALGTPAGGSMAKTAFMTGAFGGVAAGVAAVCQGARSRSCKLSWASAGAVVVVSTVPLLVWPPLAVPAQLAGTTEYMDAGWRSVVHWAPCLCFGSICLGRAFAVCWSGARAAGTGSLRMSLRLVTGACAAGLVYVALKLTVLVAWHFGADLRGWARLDQAGSFVVSSGCALAALGSGWESVVRTSRRLRYRLAFWRLRPLWQALERLAPAVVLREESGDQEYRLRRRVMEVRDAILALDDRISADLLAAARARATELGGGEALALATVVRCIEGEAARRPSPASPGAPSGPRPARLPAGPGSSFEQELAWLEEVSRWYRDRQASALGASPPLPDYQLS